jgi:hypothetical protein
VAISDAAVLSREITVLEPGLKAMTEHILEAYRIDIEHALTRKETSVP